eukprot:10769682-Alexandrium_andersonii.AAC.1
MSTPCGDTDSCLHATLCPSMQLVGDAMQEMTMGVMKMHKQTCETRNGHSCANSQGCMQHSCNDSQSGQPIHSDHEGWMRDAMQMAQAMDELR